MAELRDVIRRLKLGHGIRDIYRSTGVHRTIIRKLREEATERGWLMPGTPIPNEERIEEVRAGVRNKEADLLFDRLDTYREDFQRWLSDGGEQPAG